MEKATIALVGLNFGQYILETQLIRGPGADHFQLAGICDLDHDKAQALAEPHQLKVYPSLDAVLADRQVDAVGLFTGPVGRARLIGRILDAGKHVMTTKPLERDPQAALDVLRRAAQRGLAVHLNSPGPCLSADIQCIHDWRRQYDLGRPVAAHWTTWANYREKPDGSWYDDPHLCPAAPIFRLGIYALNDILQLLDDPTEVAVMQSRVFTQRPTADNAQLTIRFRDGALANVFASFCVGDDAPYPNALTMNYERGTIRCSCFAPGEAAAPSNLSLLAGTDDNAGPIIRETSVPNDQRSGFYQWENFRRAVQGEPLQDEIRPEQIVVGLAVIDAMARATQTGRTEPIHLPR